MKSIIFSRSLALSTGTSYSVLSSWYNIGYQATDALPATPMTTSGTLKNLYVEVTTAPGAGTSWAFTVMKNGSTTALTATISGTAVSATDMSNSVDYVAGDLFTMQIVSSGTPAASGTVSWAIDNEAPSQVMLTALGGNTTNSAATYYPLMAANAGITTVYSSVIPTAGTISNLYIYSTAAPGAAKSYTFTLVVNGSDTALTTSITGTGSGAGITTNNDVSHSVSVNAGDTAYWRCDPAGTPNAARVHVAVSFTPTVVGESIYSVATTSNMSNSATQYQSLVGAGASGPNATESARSNRHTGSTLTLKKLYVVLGAAPGAAKSYAFTVMVGGASTAITTTVSGAATTTGNDTTNVVASPGLGGIISFQSVPSGTPTATTANISMVLYHAPGNFFNLIGK